MTLHTFICRVRGNSELKALHTASERVHEVWLPLHLKSQRIARRRAYRASIRPILDYVWVTATQAQADHMMEAPEIYGPKWHLDTGRKLDAWHKWRAKVEADFTEAMHQYARNTRSFHHNYKKGQAVRLRQEGMDTFLGKFNAQIEGGPNDGLLEIETEIMGRVVKVHADPFDVAAS